MKVVNLLILFVLVASLLTTVVEGNKYETLLIDSILKNYNKGSRPVENYHSPVKVDFSISLQQILKVDEKHQTLTTNIWRHMYWKDCYLKWNPENYGNISEVSTESVTNSTKYFQNNFFRYLYVLVKFGSQIFGCIIWHHMTNNLRLVT